MSARGERIRGGTDPVNYGGAGEGGGERQRGNERRGENGICFHIRVHSLVDRSSNRSVSDQ